MSDEIKGEGLVERAKLISAVREYQMEKTRTKEKKKQKMKIDLEVT